MSSLGEKHDTVGIEDSCEAEVELVVEPAITALNLYTALKLYVLFHTN